MYMRRRRFIGLLGSTAAAWSLPARAQQAGTTRLVGVLMGTAATDSDQKAMVSAFTQALEDLGWKEGTNVHIEARWAGGDPGRLRELAGELAQLHPDAIFTQGTPATTAIRQVAPTIPTVFVNVTDPIGSGLVTSLAHPAGSVTGFTNYESSMGGKWLGMLKELAPRVTRVAAIYNPDNPISAGLLSSINAGGPTLGIEIGAKPARNAEEFERAITDWASAPNGGLLVLLDFLTLAHRKLIIDLAARYRLPAGYGLRVFATSGGLFSYGVNSLDLFRRGAAYVNQVLKGAKPADLPVQEPTKFELVINLKTAKTLDLTIPESVLSLADDVIE
jgi:putative tryptophan/tyrosine transport system substrate-binding protein